MKHKLCETREARDVFHSDGDILHHIRQVSVSSVSPQAAPDMPSAHSEAEMLRLCFKMIHL